MSFGLVISHASWRDDRRKALAEMLRDLAPLPEHWIVDLGDHRDRWRQAKVPWMLAQWRLGIGSGAEHVVFMTDDLNIAPRFWDILGAMVAAKPGKILGLMSNHPCGPVLMRNDGETWYRTNAWMVGPAYVMPRASLIAFVAWFRSLTASEQESRNEDSHINEWITKHGPGEAWHPLPSPIEHRRDIASTHDAHIGGSDDYAFERVSWRKTQAPWVRLHYGESHKAWHDDPCRSDVDAMCDPTYWDRPGQMLELP